MGDKEWRNGCRTPTQDPSTNNRWLSVGAAQVPVQGDARGHARERGRGDHAGALPLRTLPRAKLGLHLEEALAPVSSSSSVQARVGLSQLLARLLVQVPIEIVSAIVLNYLKKIAELKLEKKVSSRAARVPKRNSSPADKTNVASVKQHQYQRNGKVALLGIPAGGQRCNRR